MPKIKLKEQALYPFQYATSLKIRDINYGNHLSNDAVVGLLHEARIHMLQQLECSELNLGDSKTGIMIADLVVNYKKQGYLGDEIIIYLNINEISKRSFRVFYKIKRGDELIVLAETGIVTYNYQAESIAKIPELFLSRLKKYHETQK
ncbi:MAG: thioesterase family protein [Deltaproteobacteria bacterium]|jgi:acyl-CoA thioester hydrolase|nr:thioesterase family protein [Deltaproteobacteria bacterium]